MKTNQKGFGLFETLLALIVALAVGFGSYWVWHNHHATKPVTTKSIDSYAGWQTHTGDPVKYPPSAARDGDAVAYSFKYPSGWKFYPIGTEVTHNGSSSSTSSQKLVTADRQESDSGLVFYSAVTTLSAEDYYKKAVGDQSGLVGPVWQGLEGFTTKNGYSAYTIDLVVSNGTAYETIISNKSGAVIFIYGSDTSSYFSVYKQIFDSVKL